MKKFKVVSIGNQYTFHWSVQEHLGKDWEYKGFDKTQWIIRAFFKTREDARLFKRSLTKV